MKAFELEITPNPSSDIAKIQYVLPYSGHVRIDCVDLMGVTVATCVNQKQDMGKHSIELGVGQLAQGSYTLVLQVDGVKASSKLIIIR
jgi:hypothetical protein